jgi:phosphatidylethanolamine/phosphatidyl-N-methylethanolamine N-methyltransferase
MSDNDGVERVYTRLSRVYDLAFGLALQPGRKRAMTKMSLGPHHRVLEIGVGTGLTLPLYPTHSTVVGLDFSSAMLTQARRRRMRLRHANHLSLLRADAAQLPFGEATFDVVYAPYVITVVPDPIKVGLELRRVCRPDGRVILLNHFQSDRRATAWIEEKLSRLTTRLGFRTDLPMSEFLLRTGLRPLSIDSVNTPAIWKLVVCAPSALPLP